LREEIDNYHVSVHNIVQKDKDQYFDNFTNQLRTLHTDYRQLSKKVVKLDGNEEFLEEKNRKMKERDLIRD
jgi:hypothetical protein